jgi:4-hydroxy-3-methylbut-2-enyl diphosphate reductase
VKLFLAKPRGFCAGVDRAIDVVDVCLDLFGAPVYVKHAIVHNRHVVESLKKRGAVFVEEVAEIPESAVAVFSAHGVSPAVRREAAAKKLNVVDATCPLVTRVHLEAVRYAREGYSILLIGHRGHVEVAGTMGEAPFAITLVHDVNDARSVRVANPNKVMVLTQTTLSAEDVAEITTVLRERFPKLETPPKGDICYATTNRQTAVRELAKHCDVILIVGSKESSNANRLVEVARRAGAKSYLVDSSQDIDLAWVERAQSIGVASGASTPEASFAQVIAWLRQNGAEAPQEIAPVHENVWFPLPPELVKIARERGTASGLIEKHRIRTDSKLTVG